ncbi:hypothetical protein HF209_30680 [Pseudomonas sp. WS 5096]|uniref:Uncharacterized protein n=1 Tax=Pseudomonas cremoris TaxID=2724178 RepID=A0ABR6TH66_9PSED|nr:hypothetical protein [Pseudomonas cremoris]MBC2385324.1 hypothetical protein [Pseudomonas cremoris]
MSASTDTLALTIAENQRLKDLLASWIAVDGYTDHAVAPIELIEGTRAALVEHSPSKVVVLVENGNVQAVQSSFIGLDVEIVNRDLHPQAVFFDKQLFPVIPRL